MDYFLLLLCLGLVVALTAFIPIYAKKLKISHVIPMLFLGAVLYMLNAPLPWPDPLWNFEIAKIITEIIVIISLMVAGLKVGTRYDWKHWRVPFRLVGITMTLSMVAVFVITHYMLKLNGAVSLLLASVLAPTDPVLASELQLEHHQKNQKEKDTGLRFALTGEAGINDGLAFPFVYVAILWSESAGFLDLDFTHILSYYFLYKIVVGVIIGGALGLAVSYLLSTYNYNKQKRITNGFLALALTFLSYGLAELASSYGFLAVFATGVGLQYFERHAHTKPSSPLLNFIENTEKLTSLLWTVFFGGAVVSGILSYTDWEGIVFSLVFVLLIRPVTGYLALLNTRYPWKKRLAISFFGIKGIGSVFYLSFALLNGAFEGYEALFGIVSYTILFSILIHGFFSVRAISYFYDRY